MKMFGDRQFLYFKFCLRKLFEKITAYLKINFNKNLEIEFRLVFHRSTFYIVSDFSFSLILQFLKTLNVLIFTSKTNVNIKINNE